MNLLHILVNFSVLKLKVMRTVLACLMMAIFLGVSTNSETKAQSVQLFSSNTLNGAINGVVLGGASMFVTDKKVNAPFNKNLEDLYALQVGLGLGSLYGLGMGAYDVINGEGRQILVSGFFNDGNNSSIIVLMDTFYGAAAGGIIALSVSLVSNDPIVEAMQYGTGIGAFIGFGFGVFDTFFIAERSAEPATLSYTENKTAEGLATLSLENGTSFGIINPTLFSTLKLSSQDFGITTAPAVQLVNLRVNF